MKQETFFVLLMRYRWLCLLAVCLISGLAGSQLSKIEIDNSNESFFMTGDPTKARLDAFNDTFGNDDFVYILVDVEDAFAAETLERLAELAERLELEVPHLLELTWLGNVERIEGVPGGIVIDDLIPNLELSDDQREALARRTLADPLYRDRLVSGDGKAHGLLLEFENYPELGIDPRKDVPPVILSLIDEFSDLETHVVGGPVMDYVMDERTAVEVQRWMLAALLGMCIVLAFTTRSLVGVLVPAATVVLSVVWTMGLFAFIGFRLNLLGILVPTLLLCVGIGDTMHVVAELKQSMREGQARREGLLHTLSLVTGPIALTTLTTAVGFLAFTVTDLVPLVELGVQAATGVVIAFVLTYLFAVPVLSFGRARQKTEGKSAPDVFDRLLAATAESVIRHKTAYGVGFALATVIALVGVARLEIETNTVQDMPADDPLRVAFHYVDDHMGGSMSVEFVIDSGAENGIKDQALLQRVAELQAFLDDHPLVTQTSSVVDQLKQMNRAVHENDPAYFRLPDSDAQVAEYMLLYESGGGSQLEQFVSFTYDQMRVQARTKTVALRDVRRLQEDVREFVDANFSTATSATIYATGALPTFERIADLVKIGQARSFVFAFVAIAVIMMVTLRSVSLGLIAMVPNVLPVAFALGVMGWMGAQLNVIGLVLAPMIIGVAVDDTVHFFVRYRRYFAQMGDYDSAYRETMRTVGRPLLFTTMVLVVGFMGFLISIFAGPRNFAISSGVAFCGALLAEFLLVPVLLSWLRPLSDRNQEHETSSTVRLQS
ncbi:MAG: efflux RND transporter permease subunit [Pseudomonadota bacterium]